MKRKGSYILCALGLALLLFGGCAAQPVQEAQIGAEEAKQQALEASGLTADRVTDVRTGLDTRNGLDYYQVEFTAAGHTYQYAIDALTGAVIEVQMDPGASEGALTAEEAKAKALAHAGLAENQVTFETCRLDWEHGRQVYEIEFRTADTEYEYEVEAATGAICSFEWETKGAPSAGSRLTEEQGKELALTLVPGATLADIREFKTDYEADRAEFEGKIVYDGMEYEFKIDAYSGAFRSWEAERIGR